MTSNNFIIVYEKLEKRQKNKIILATKYLKKINFAYSPQKPPSLKLWTSLNLVNDNSSAIRELELPLESW